MNYYAQATMQLRHLDRRLAPPNGSMLRPTHLHHSLTPGCSAFPVARGGIHSPLPSSLDLVNFLVIDHVVDLGMFPADIYHRLEKDCPHLWPTQQLVDGESLVSQSSKTFLVFLLSSQPC